MSIATEASYLSKTTAPLQRLQDTKQTIVTRPGYSLSSFWLSAPDAGVAPTTAAVPDRTTLGAMGQQNTSGTQRLAQLVVSLAIGGYLLICDRLSHQGGLSGTSTSAQTTNLPTAALTRFTDGVGVFAALEIYTAIGTTGSTVSASYTNDAGTSGQVSNDTPFGTSTGNYGTAARAIILPWAAGDRGVRSVESVTLATSTGTVGNFGVTLFKPLLALPLPPLNGGQFSVDALLNLSGNLPAIPNDACLQYFVCTNNTTSGILLTSLRFIED